MLLLTHGADPELRDHEGSTALSHAIATEDPSLVRLLAPSSDLSAIDGLGYTYLCRAAERPDVLAALLACGADPNQKTPSGRTALYYACIKGCLHSVQLLAGQSYLAIAMSKRHPDVVRLLASTLNPLPTTTRTSDLFFQPFTAANVPRGRHFLQQCGWGAPEQPPRPPVEGVYFDALSAVLSDPAWPDVNPEPAIAAAKLPLSGAALLRDEARYLAELHPLVPHPSHGVYFQDAAVDKAKWRRVLGNPVPGVIDVIDPDLYCAVAGRTRHTSAPHGGALEPGRLVDVGATPPADMAAHVSRFVQWLPTPVAVDPSTGRAIFSSYVNNVDEVNTKLVACLEAALTKLLPLLARAMDRRPRFMRTERMTEAALATRAYREAHKTCRRIKASKVARWRARAGIDFAAEAYEPQFVQTLPVSSLRQPPLNLSSALVVVQVQTFREGSELSWRHGSGLGNEAIAAIGVVCVDAENVAGVRLSFREHVGCLRDKREAAGKATVQESGYVTLVPGRMVALPAATSYQVAAVDALDATLPAHMTLVTYYVVHPSASLLSTAYVLPQQMAFWRRVFEGTRLGSLPDGVLDAVFAFAGGAVMDETEAQAVALAAKEARAASLALLQAPAA
ncbi:hypothetical protein ACHHYP_09755 [Achlya hypogyna]|uniref:DUF4246 domain-containing protein n=1 Tax=Achlya hypogyna TaxID=1202772 RepID=A0A1V9YMG0_ACHHY|nr:hypothetical protein ACHHYP_09755 [Achlya hypogyna]